MGRNDNGRCCALPYRSSWVLVHADYIGARNYRDVHWERTPGVGPNHRVVADKEECVTRIFACPLKTTWHGFSSAVIAAWMLGAALL